MKLMKFATFFVATNSLVAADSGSIRSAVKNSSEGAGSEVSGRPHEGDTNYNVFFIDSLIHFDFISSYYSICRENVCIAFMIRSACL